MSENRQNQGRPDEIGFLYFDWLQQSFHKFQNQYYCILILCKKTSRKFRTNHSFRKRSRQPKELYKTTRQFCIVILHARDTDNAESYH